MAAMRLNMEDLSMLLRKNNIFTFAGVEYGIIEPNGQLSVLKRPELEYTTKKDIKQQTQAHKFLPTEIISDGKLLGRNLAELNLSREWLSVADLDSGRREPAGSEYIYCLFFTGFFCLFNTELTPSNRYQIQSCSNNKERGL